MSEDKTIFRWLNRFFEPRIDFYQLLVEQAETTLSGMEALRDWLKDGSEERCQLVRDFEHEADKRKLALQESLVDTLITPMDREDIYDLSARLDEVINSAKFTVRQIEALDFQSAETHAIKMSELLVKGTRCLRDSFSELNGDLGKATEFAMKARKFDGKVSKTYRDAMRDFMTQDDTRKIIVCIEVYRTMLLASQRIDTVGEKLLHVIVKSR